MCIDNVIIMSSTLVPVSVISISKPNIRERRQEEVGLSSVELCDIQEFLYFVFSYLSVLHT